MNNLVYIIPIILCIIEILILRFCFTGCPRILILVATLLSFVPIFNMVLFIVLLMVMIIYNDGEVLELKDNKFNRYWFSR